MTHSELPRPWWAPTALEIASGVVLGFDDDHVEKTPPRPSVSGPLAVLEAAVLPALQRSPCVVSFSGGMDSSFVLAVASRVARREGLDDPVPVTWRFSGAPYAAESEWQDAVLQSLQLTDHVVLQADDELDLIGPVATKVLRQYGVVHPANLHLHVPIIEIAAGGAILTGFGGDQVLAGFGRSTKLSRRVIAHLPPSVRVHSRMLRGRDPFPWLRPETSRDLQLRHLIERQTQPTGLVNRIAWHLRRRDLVMARQQFEVVAADLDVLAAHPFLDGGFHAALHGWDRPAGLVGRAAMLGELGGSVFPRDVWAPRPKARFSEVFVRRATTDFIGSWTGEGADTNLIDTVELMKFWKATPAAVGSALLVQQLWIEHLSR